MDDKVLLEAIGQIVDAKLQHFGTEVDAKLQHFGTEVDAKLQHFGTEVDAKLQHFGTEVDAKLQHFGTEVDAKLAQQRKELMRDVNILLENVVTPKFNLLAEGQADILRRMPNEDDMGIIDGRLHDLEVEVRQLKKAQ